MKDLSDRLRDLDAFRSPVTWQDIEARPPRAQMPDRPGKRLLAGAVAFAVFAAGGWLAWSALGGARDEQQPIGPQPGLVTATLDVATTGEHVDPSASLTFEGRTQDAAFSSFGWANSIYDTATPELNDFLAIPRGSELVVEGTAESVTGELGDPGRFPFERIEGLDLSTGRMTLDAELGRYVLTFQATWPQGTIPFYFGIEIVATTVPLAPGSLVFTREQPEEGCDLFTIEPDGSGLRALTATPSACETGPAVAPGGSTVAVSLDLDDIAVIDLATSALRRLTDDATTFDVSPAWSPDGSQIAFSRGPELGPSHLFVMDADGTDVRQLTQGSGSDRNAAWSPDGRRIAFARSGNFGYEVYVMDADGSSVTAVTSVAVESAPYPAWSPDGSQIALDVDGAIYVMSVDGTGLRRLSPELPRGVFDMRPSWSPDGAQIAFERYTNEDVAASAEDGDIWIVDVDGTAATRVTRGPAIDWGPQWVSGSAG